MRRDWTLMTRHGFIYIFRTCQVRELGDLFHSPPTGVTSLCEWGPVPGNTEALWPLTAAVELQVSVVSTIIATLFLRTTLHTNSVADGQNYLGLIFFVIIHMVRPCSILHPALSHLLSCMLPPLLIWWSCRQHEGNVLFIPPWLSLMGCDFK